jgi:hypothetical protein
MLDRSPVMCTRDLTKLAHPAFCSAGTADPVDISSSLMYSDKGALTPPSSCAKAKPEMGYNKSRCNNVPASASILASIIDLDYWLVV